MRALTKKYRHIRSDIQPVLDRLEAGDFAGDRIRDTSYMIFKVRVQNSDIAKGKSSGYRLIYQVKTPTQAILITIYSKLDQADISPDQIRRILLAFEQQGNV